VFTVSLNTTQNVAGIFNGVGVTAPGTVTISGTGALNVPAGQQGFYTFAPGVTIINVPIMGPAQVVLERNGVFYFNATNTYTGGTQIGFSSSAFAGTIYVNNSSSFGSGAITMTTFETGAIAVQGSSALTIPNPVTTAAAALSITGNAAGLTFSGAWNMAATAAIGSGGGGNQVIISGVMGGAGGLNKFGPGILKLTAANTFTGPTTVSNGVLALGPSGVIRSSSLLLSPGSSGAIFDVSAISPTFTLNSTTTLMGLGSGTATATAANIKGAVGGTVSLGSRPVNLSFAPTTFIGDLAHPSLYVSQGALNLNNNVITITNTASTPLGIGTYRVIQVGNGSSGTISGTPNPVVTVLGNGIATNTVAALSVANGNVNLVVKPPAVVSAFSLSQSNAFGIGAVNVTLSARVSAGAVYPVKNETVTVSINGSSRTAVITNNTGDFSTSFSPGAVPYAATNSFTFTYAGDGSLGGVTNAVLVPGHPFLVGDGTPGFFGGLNLIVTNASSIPMYTWSTTNSGLPVTDWMLEGQMAEQPLSGGQSRYTYNVSPTNSLTFYVCGQTLSWPYQSPTALQWIVNNILTYDFAVTNTTITPAGVLGIPAAPVIVINPVSQTVVQGRTTRFDSLATGSTPLSYQWYFNDSPTSAQASSLVVTNPGPTDTGSYVVVATNVYGAATSSPASLTLVPVPQLVFQVVSNAVQLSAIAGPSNTFVVQTSSNLTTWAAIATNVADQSGAVQFTDTNVLARPIRFYRLLFP
jgi:autotransporter-associated beta strand protein